MPKITPNNLSLFTEPVLNIYIALEEEVFQMMAKRLKTSPEHGKDYVLQWQVDKMQQLGILNKETIKELSRATGLATSEIEGMIREVGFGTVQEVDGELKTVYPPRPMISDIDNILESYVSQTFLDINNFVNQTLITTNYGTGTVAKTYQKIIEETTGRVLAGTTKINKALSETIIKWKEKGIDTSFVDKGGRRWSLESYVRTVLRSTANRTYNELRMSRMSEYGVGLVVMGSHSSARPACAPIQGKVLDITESRENPDYPNIYDFGYGEPWGVRGINCRHQFYPFVEGLNTNNQPQVDPAKAEERYQKEQKQRYYERQIRKSKQSLKLAEEIGDPDTIDKYKKQVRSRQAKIREYIAEKDLPRFYDREKIY